MGGTTKQYVFNLYFNDKSGGGNTEWAEKTRDQALIYLKRLFENKAKFSCIAKDRDRNTLLLRGYVNWNSPCTQEYIKRMLGKYSSCKPSYFGDMVSLCRLLHVDRGLVTTGRLPTIGGNSIKKMKPFASDPKFVVKILLESIDKKEANGKNQVLSTDEKEEANRRDPIVN